MIGTWFARFLSLGDPIWQPLGSPPRDRKELGAHAKQLLEDPVLHAALERVEAALIATWKASDAADEEGRERIYATWHGMQRFRQELRLMIANAGDAVARDADQ